MQGFKAELDRELPDLAFDRTFDPFKIHFYLPVIGCVISEVPEMICEVIRCMDLCKIVLGYPHEQM